MKTKVKISILLAACITSLTVKSQNSEDNVKFKGLDIYLDLGSIKSTLSRDIYFANNSRENKNFFNNLNYNFTESNNIKRYLNVQTGLILKIKPCLLKQAFTNQEIRFGLGYNFISNENTYKYKLIYSNGYKTEDVYNYTYKSSQEQLHVSYFILSKRFLKNFKSYTGLGAIFNLERVRFNSLNSYIVTRNYYDNNNSITRSEDSDNKNFNNESFNYPVFGLLLPMGLRYNIDCHANIFTEIKIGYSYSPIFPINDRFQRTISIGFGIRYKFNDDQSYSNNNIFW